MEHIHESKYFSDGNAISTTNESTGFHVNFLWSVDPENKELFVCTFNTSFEIKIHIPGNASERLFFLLFFNGEVSV